MNNFKYINKNSVFGFGNDVLKNILISRGIENVDLFLNLNNSVIEDFKSYDNIEYCANLYLKHINYENSIVWLIDFDTDGDTSTSESILYTKDVCNYLNKKCNINYVHHSKKSHGLDDVEAFNKILNLNPDLVIIPDAGSNDINELLKLKELGIDFIILDHHQANKKLLQENKLYKTIINNQLSENVKNKNMTGVGVVYKFNKCVDSILGVNFSDKYLDLVAFGLVADSADMRDLECRYLVNLGMDLIKSNKGKCKLLNTIFKDKLYSMNNEMTINGMAFYMIPAVNCIIRGGTYEEREILFKAYLSSDETFTDKVRGKGEIEFSIEDYVVRLYGKLKRKQDKIVNASIDELSKQIETCRLDKMEIMVINGENIEDSTYNRVIVNKLSSKYKKHAILLKPFCDNILGGSATGCRNKDIKDFRQWCEDTKLFKQSAGHPMAFGVQLLNTNITSLYNLISQIPSNDVLTYDVDGVYNKDTLSENIIKLIGGMDKIWGGKLDEPIFAIEDLIIPKSDVYIQGKTKSTLKLLYNGISFIKFKSNEDEYNKIIENENNKFCIIGRFKINEYNGSIYPQILIEDYMFSKTDEVKPFKF